MAHPQLSIVIPAYNEGARIEATLERVMLCVAERGWDAEVLVVDDGSTDRTPEIVERWMEVHPRLHLVQNPGNRGKATRCGTVCCRRRATWSCLRTPIFRRRWKRRSG